MKWTQVCFNISNKCFNLSIQMKQHSQKIKHHIKQMFTKSPYIELITIITLILKLKVLLLVIKYETEHFNILFGPRNPKICPLLANLAPSNNIRK